MILTEIYTIQKEKRKATSHFTTATMKLDTLCRSQRDDASYWTSQLAQRRYISALLRSASKPVHLHGLFLGFTYSLLDRSVHVRDDLGGLPHEHRRPIAHWSEDARLDEEFLRRTG